MDGQNHSTISWPLPVFGGLLLVVCTGCGGVAALSPEASSGISGQSITPQPPPANRVQVKIEQFAYSPRSLTVATGTTVVWINHDDAPHTVTEENRQFESMALDTDDAYEHRFDVPGTYRYFCALHPHMTGQITVQLETPTPQ
jgi:plastocyanin